jgi:glycosyltransferase involved in cell wall biosynthesis
MTSLCFFALSPSGEITDQPAVTTVVFTAHNRRDMVLDAIDLALKQTVPVHIIVADDASTDGTGEAVAAAYPGVTYVRSDRSFGPCYQRNRGVELAQTEIVFPLDDDSMLIDSTTLEAAIRDFTPADVGIVCMPFCNVLKDTLIHHLDPPNGAELPFDFAACAHGVRRSAYLSVGGYNEDLFYTQEEGDLALRMYDHGGWRTLFGTSPVLHHMQSNTKTSYIQDYTGARNKILFYYRYAPLRYLPIRIGGAVIVDFLHGLRRKRLRGWFNGVRDGFIMVLAGKAKRTPVKLASFRAYLAQR